MYLFFDTETTGKPKNYKAPMNDLGNWPRVIQLGFATFTEEGKLVNEYCKLIQPDGWVVPAEPFWIEHGYSTEKNMAEGVPLLEALACFLTGINQCHTMVAHNITFDYNIVGAELIRTGVKTARRLDRICTMESSTNYCKLPGPRGYKWPSLTELHQKLFNETFDGAHDAMADVRACAPSFFKLKDLGIIRPAMAGSLTS